MLPMDSWRTLRVLSRRSDGRRPLTWRANRVRLTYDTLRLSNLICCRSHPAPSPSVAIHALCLRCEGPDGLRPLTRRTYPVKLAHMRFLLSNSVRWASLSEAAYCTRHARGVGCRGARGPSPLTR